MKRSRGYVRTSVPVVGRDQVGVERIGAALIGGERGGDARGAGAIDIQTARADPAQVASGDQSVAYGVECIAAGLGSVAVGLDAQAAGASDVAIGAHIRALEGSGQVVIGVDCQSLSPDAIALGRGAVASGSGSLAIGVGAETRVAGTINLGGLLIVKRSCQVYGSWATLAGAQIVILSPVVDLTQVTGAGYDLPDGCRFWWNECGVICTEWEAVTVQPTVRFGLNNPGQYALQKTAALTTALTDAGLRQVYASPLRPDLGTRSLYAGVTAPAVGAALMGRFYFCGLLIEDEE